MRLTDGATCTEGAAVAKAGKGIMDGEIGNCDLIEVDSGSVTFVTGKLVVNEVEGVLRSQPPAHAQVLASPCSESDGDADTTTGLWHSTVFTLSRMITKRCKGF